MSVQRPCPVLPARARAHTHTVTCACSLTHTHTYAHRCVHIPAVMHTYGTHVCTHTHTHKLTQPHTLLPSILRCWEGDQSLLSVAEPPGTSRVTLCICMDFPVSCPTQPETVKTPQQGGGLSTRHSSSCHMAFRVTLVSSQHLWGGGTCREPMCL